MKNEQLAAVLNDLGYDPHPDNKGKIGFTYEGSTYVLVQDPNDEELVSLCIRGLYENCDIFSDADAMVMCLDVSRSFAFGKAVPLDRGENGSINVLFYTEAIVDNEAYFRKILPKFLKTLRSMARFYMERLQNRGNLRHERAEEAKKNIN